MAIYSTFTDQELAVLLKQGDQQGYTEIFNRYQPLLFLHALKKMRDEEEAKDVVQEILRDLQFGEHLQGIGRESLSGAQGNGYSRLC